MISRAWYVQCDRCGDPAPVSVEGAVSARHYAQAEAGFVRHQGPNKMEAKGELRAGVLAA